MQCGCIAAAAAEHLFSAATIGISRARIVQQSKELIVRHVACVVGAQGQESISWAITEAVAITKAIARATTAITAVTAAEREI